MRKNSHFIDCFNWRLCHYLAVTRLYAILINFTSNENEAFYFLTCLQLFRTEVKRNSHEKVCKNYNFCEIAMPNGKKR